MTRANLIKTATKAIDCAFGSELEPEEVVPVATAIVDAILAELPKPNGFWKVTHNDDPPLPEHVEAHLQGVYKDMSLHNKPEYNTPDIIAALKTHGMKADSPSQLSDAFRLGYAYASARIAELEWQDTDSFKNMAPFTYDSRLQKIVGTNAKIGGMAMVLDVRSWGYLTGKGHGALGLPSEKAAIEQDAFGNMVAGMLNNKSRPALPPETPASDSDNMSDVWDGPIDRGGETS